MNKISYICLLLTVFWLSSCQKEEIRRYEQRAGVYFSTYQSSFSFIDQPDSDIAIVRLPVDITGLPADYDREFAIALPWVDTVTTAEEDQYKIGNCLVKAGEGKGFAEVELYKDERLRDSVYTLRFEIRKTADFPEIRLNRTIMTLSFTNRLIRPDNWNHLGLGDYSTAWWSFVLGVTEGNKLPYWMGGPTAALNPDPEYYYMTFSELGAWKSRISKALDKYNADHPGEPLRHDDGPKKGEKVEMPA